MIYIGAFKKEENMHSYINDLTFYSAVYFY